MEDIHKNIDSSSCFWLIKLSFDFIYQFLHNYIFWLFFSESISFVIKIENSFKMWGEFLMIYIEMNIYIWDFILSFTVKLCMLKKGLNLYINHTVSWFKKVLWQKLRKKQKETNKLGANISNEQCCNDFERISCALCQ